MRQFTLQLCQRHQEARRVRRVRRHLGVVHVEAVAAGAEEVVLVAVAVQDIGVGVQQREARAADFTREDAALGRRAAVEGLAGREAGVAEDGNAGDYRRARWSAGA